MKHPVAEYLHELYLISGVSVPGPGQITGG